MFPAVLRSALTVLLSTALSGLLIAAATSLSLASVSGPLSA